jgi:hypothetical protein
MKVNEIIVEDVMDGIKTAGKGLGTMAKGLGQAAGSAAMSTLRGLDKLSGGTGNIGTQRQQDAYAAQNKEKNTLAVRNKLPADAMVKFEREMSKKGFDINNPSTYNTNQLGNEMQIFASQYFAGGESQILKKYINQSIPYQPLPAILNPKSIQTYFSEINKIRSNGYAWAQQNAQSQPATTATNASTQETLPKQSTASQGLDTGFTIVNSNPIVLRYGKQTFELSDDGQWTYLNSNKRLSPGMSAILNKQLEKL